MDALNGFDDALLAMKRAVLDLREDGRCRKEDASGATTALAMLEMVGRRVRSRAGNGREAAVPRADWRERQLPAGDR